MGHAIDIDRSDPPRLPTRAVDGHKGTFGRVAVVGGAAGSGAGPTMVGAPALAAMGALRSGAGLVRVITPAPVLHTVLALCPSATGIGLTVDADGALADEAYETAMAAVRETDAAVVGCGLGRESEAFVRAIDTACETPTVMDADGLVAGAQPGGPRVLTPHPGEFSRLAGALGIEGNAADPDERPGLAGALARATGAVVVLKGRGSVVSDGARAWVCDRGHPCLGTAGTGDVLAGVLAGLLADRTGDADRYDRVRSGVLAHAIAGERWAQQTGASGGMLAPELASLLPSAVESLRA